MMKQNARRYSDGKLRHELIPNIFKDELAKVYTIGAEKYTIRDEDGNIIEDGANNWRNGLSWKQTLGSVYRHLNKFAKGEDFDSDFPKDLLDKYGQVYHLANAAWGIAALIEYYKIYPQGDDRPHSYLNRPKIGLDIDEVLADWVTAYKEFYNYPDNHEFNSWYIHFDILERCKTDLGEDFYLNLKPKIKASELPFEPHCYITSRNIDTKITEKWLYQNGFPCVPVRSVGLSESKAAVAKEMGIDIFVDDVYKNFVELNKAGVCCFLFDAPHNRQHNVGYKRIKSLSELAIYF